jgi:hypothetical protein
MFRKQVQEGGVKIVCRGLAMEISLPQLPDLVPIRFFADFDIRIRQSDITGFSTQQLLLLQAIAASRPTLHRIAGMAVETDLVGVTGGHLGDLFTGPSNEEILECFLACLSERDRSYWEKLRDGPGDSLHQELMPVFLAFGVTLRRAGLEELSPTGESTRKIVGPTLDANNL